MECYCVLLHIEIRIHSVRSVYMASTSMVKDAYCIFVEEI